ncbi:AraC family transcriptional regulator [Aquabacterium sp.]|uniref:AraC family transcriptional regulator n=1 Tax=Aquabacterium sp. TaxID=1872578 RepID=UPI0035AE026B
MSAARASAKVPGKPLLPGPIISDLVAPPVPVSFPRLLLQVVGARGLSAARLMQSVGMTEADLERPEGLVYASEYVALIAQAVALTEDPCLGCEMGLNMPPTMHGFLGYALLSASTLGEALELGVKYTRLASRFVDVQVEYVADGAVLTLRELLPLGSVHQFGIESTMAGWFHTAEQLVGAVGLRGPGSLAELRFAWPRPAAFDRYEQRLPDSRFGCAAHQIFVPRRELQRPLALAHPLAARQARAHCDTELAQLLSSEGSFITTVAEALTLSATGYPGMDQIAARLHLSTRTLMRRLDALGVSFRQLMDERRRLDAQALLGDPHLPIEAIAARLGYANPANFTRAFRRWTGEAPSQFRMRVTAARIAGHPKKLTTSSWR